MDKPVKIMGVDFDFRAIASVEFKDKSILTDNRVIEIPLKVERNQFGKSILVPDFTPVAQEIRRLRTLARIK